MAQILVKRHGMRGRWRTWSRRRRVVAVLLALGMLAAVGVALAVIFLRAGIVGSATVQTTPGVKWNGTITKTADSGDGIACTASVAADQRTATVTITGAYAGSWCDMAGNVINTDNNKKMTLQDVTFGPGVDAAFVQGCGQVVDNQMSGSTGVVIRFTIPPGTAAGTYPASATAGVTGVVTGYSAGACPSAS